MTNGNGISFLAQNRSQNSSNQCSCQSRFSRRDRESFRNPSEILIKILWASYGPCEYHCFNDSDHSPIPSTRDCTSFLVNLLEATHNQEILQLKQHEARELPRLRRDKNKHNNVVRLPYHPLNFVYLLPGVGSNKNYSEPSPPISNDRRGFNSMNAVFGDPCPGKTKRLDVRYTITEVFTKGNDLQEVSSSQPYFRTEIHSVSFAEHETVRLRRCLTGINTATALVGESFDHSDGDDNGNCDYCSHNVNNNLSWQLQPATSEIALPIILPFLSLWERMQCRSICRCWKDIVHECGISRTIDVNSTEMISSRRSTTAMTSPRASNSFSRSMLRGLLAYSYSSLQSLFLSGFEELQKEDLHPTLPLLRNLSVLDISHCSCLDDSTLQILADPNAPSSTTLRVLYLKGLRNITDTGLQAICSSCCMLEVLDLSNLTNITDNGGRYIQRLIFLRALFLRDNWQLTNETIDAIATACSKLEQLTLWGCVQLRHLTFDSWNSNGKRNARANTCNHLVILNLWGCYDLHDDAADVLSNIPNLNCLIVSECHRLTDRFVHLLVDGKKQPNRENGGLQHLHLRYLKRITDAAVVSIALNLRDLHSLDLSFCSKVTTTGIYRLLDELRNTLIELRLKSCKGLQIGTRNLEGFSRRRIRNQLVNGNNGDHSGILILNALRRRPHSKIDHSLSLLDVRGCGGQPGINLPYNAEDTFVKGMSSLNFEQKVPGFFSKFA